MKKLLLVFLSFYFLNAFAQNLDNIDKKLFIYGGQVNKEFIAYTANLTNKKKPKVCFIPTAAADNASYINYWYELCSGLEIEPHVLEVWISSTYQDESWEEQLADMDAIIVGGGNTLNMLAIWKAQGIDGALRKEYEEGKVLAGGSAGSLCWFNAGTTDSRPKELSIVEGLGFLNYSHCPHYHSEASRKPLYFENILTGKLGEGYACDDKAGLLFINGKLEKGVTLDTENNSYFVSLKNGKVVEEKIASEIIK